jgi:hypothetical protein
MTRSLGCAQPTFPSLIGCSGRLSVATKNDAGKQQNLSERERKRWANAIRRLRKTPPKIAEDPTSRLGSMIAAGRRVATT